MISLDGRTAESDGDELDEGPSLTTTRSHPSKIMATRPLTRQTLDELIRKAHQRYCLAKTLLSTTWNGYTEWIWTRAMSRSTSTCAVIQSCNSSCSPRKTAIALLPRITGLQNPRGPLGHIDRSSQRGSSRNPEDHAAVSFSLSLALGNGSSELRTAASLWMSLILTRRSTSSSVL